MHNALYPSREHVAIMNDGNVTMWLLAVACWQKKAGTSVVMPKGSSNLPRIGYVSLPAQLHSDFVARIFFLEPASLQWIFRSKRGRAPNISIALVLGACCNSNKGWRPWPELALRAKVCSWLVCTCNILQVVVHINTVVNTLPSGHVQGAPYIQPYFCRILWSPVLTRPIHSAPNSARLRACSLMDVMLHTRSATCCMIGGASSIQKGQLQAE